MSGPFLSVATRSRRRFRRGLGAVGISLAAVALLAAAFAVLAFFERDTIARGTTIGGVDVGGLSEADARRALVRAAARRVLEPIRLVGPDGEIVTNGRALGADPRIEAAIGLRHRLLGIEIAHIAQPAQQERRPVLPT